MLDKVIADINGVKSAIGPVHSNPLLMANRFGKIVSRDFPAIRFGMETAWLDLQHGGKRIIFYNDFLSGKPIPINGLIWMGKSNEMIEQVHTKVAQGFRCIKLKIGGLDFKEECDVLREIRGHYPSSDVTIRLDANGAFSYPKAAGIFFIP